MLMHAMSADIVLHLWTHPHNFITGKDMFNIFESILAHVSLAKNKGDIVPITQQDYCKRMAQKRCNKRMTTCVE